MMLRPESGWFGVFTREQAANAEFPNGSRIQKAVHEPGDGTPVGTHGTVLGSISNPKVSGGMVGYFVEWDNRPRHAVFVKGPKIARGDDNG